MSSKKVWRRLQHHIYRTRSQSVQEQKTTVCPDEVKTDLAVPNYTLTMKEMRKMANLDGERLLRKLEIWTENYLQLSNAGEIL